MAPKEWCAVILDVSKTMREPRSSAPVRIAQEAVQQLILQKILLSPKDDIALLLMGTPDSNNTLAAEYPGQYQGVSVLQYFGGGGVTPALLRQISEYIDKFDDGSGAGAGEPTDPLDAIVVAATLFKNKKKGDSARVFMVSDLSHKISDEEQAEAIADGLVALGVGLTVFSAQALQPHPSPDARHNAGILAALAARTPGGSFVPLTSSALEMIGQLRARAVGNVTIFRGNLDIAGIVQIPVWAYKSTAEAKMASLRTGARSAFASEVYGTGDLERSTAAAMSDDASTVTAAAVSPPSSSSDLGSAAPLSQTSSLSTALAAPMRANAASAAAAYAPAAAEGEGDDDHQPASSSAAAEESSDWRTGGTGASVRSVPAPALLDRRYFAVGAGGSSVSRSTAAFGGGDEDGEGDGGDHPQPQRRDADEEEAALDGGPVGSSSRSRWEVQKTDLVKTFAYGGEHVPVGAVEAGALRWEHTKELVVLGFAPSASVPRYAALSSVDVIVPPQGGEKFFDPAATTALSALARALATEGSVALVRWIKRSLSGGATPLFGILIPGLAPSSQSSDVAASSNYATADGDGAADVRAARGGSAASSSSPTALSKRRRHDGADAASAAERYGGEVVSSDDDDDSAPTSMSGHRHHAATTSSSSSSSSASSSSASSSYPVIASGNQYVVYPCEVGVDCLYFVQMPFTEDLRGFAFANYGAAPRFCPSEEQQGAMDALVDEMDLTAVPNQRSSSGAESGGTHEALLPTSTFNPVLARYYRTLVTRSVHPGAPIPDVPPAVAAYLRPDPALIAKAAGAMRRVQGAFTGTLKRSRGAATLLGGRTLIGDETGASSFTSSSNTTTTGPAAEWGAEEASAQHVKGGAEGEGDSKRGGGDGSGGAASDMFGGGYTGDGGGGGGSSRGITVISSTNAVDDFNRMLRRTDWAGAAVEAVRQMAALVERLSQDPHMRDRCLAAAVALRNGALSAKDSAKFNELLMRRVTALETEIALATHQAGAHGNVDTADFCSPAVISEALFWAQAARVCALAPLSREDDPVLLDITAGDAAAWGARMVALGDAVTPKRLSALQRAATQAAGATQAGGGAGGGVDESEFE